MAKRARQISRVDPNPNKGQGHYSSHFAAPHICTKFKPAFAFAEKNGNKVRGTAFFRALNRDCPTVYAAVRFWHQRSSALRFDSRGCFASVASGSAANDVFALDIATTSTAAVATFSEMLSLHNNTASARQCS